jgi:hypothetical protein
MQALPEGGEACPVPFASNALLPSKEEQHTVMRREMLGRDGSHRCRAINGVCAREARKPKQLVSNASGGSQIASLRQSYFNDLAADPGMQRLVGCIPGVHHIFRRTRRCHVHIGRQHHAAQEDDRQHLE